MKTALRMIVLVGVFVGAALLAYAAVMSHATMRYGTYGAEVRLAAEMAGLFAGGIAVAVVGVVMVWRRGRRQG
jgi:uncharacterized membrane protein